MGHVNNSNINRLGLSVSWRNKVISLRSENLSSSYFYFELRSFLERIFEEDLRKKWFNRRLLRGIYSHFILFTRNKKLVVQIFLYDRFFTVFTKQFLMSVLLDTYSPRNEGRLELKRIWLNSLRYILTKGNTKILKKILFFRADQVLRIYFRRFIYFHYSRFLEKKISSLRVNGHRLPTKVVFEFVPIFAFQGFNLDTVTRRAARGLQYVSFFRIVKPLFNHLKERFQGVKLECSGRFTRRQRASFFRFVSGSIPLGTFSTPVSYRQFSAVTRYGVGSVKIWLHGNNLQNKILKSSVRFFQGSIIDYSVTRCLDKDSISLSNGKDSFSPFRVFVPLVRIKTSSATKMLHPKMKSRLYWRGLDFYHRRIKLIRFLSRRKSRKFRLKLLKYVFRFPFPSTYNYLISHFFRLRKLTHTSGLVKSSLHRDILSDSMKITRYRRAKLFSKVFRDMVINNNYKDIKLLDRVLRSLISLDKRGFRVKNSSSPIFRSKD